MRRRERRSEKKYMLFIKLSDYLKPIIIHRQISLTLGAVARGAATGAERTGAAT